MKVGLNNSNASSMAATQPPIGLVGSTGSNGDASWSNRGNKLTNSTISSSTAHSRLAFFDHLLRKQQPKNADGIEAIEQEQLHPATVKLGGLYGRGIIQTDDDRVTALIAVFYSIVRDYHAPPKRVLREDLDRYVSRQVQFLVDSRQISKGMGNLIKFFRFSISRIPLETSEADAKAILASKLQTFLEERIVYAAESITRSVTSIIANGDVILTFGFSPLVTRILFEVAESRSFRMVVVDARPLHEGLQTLTALSHKGVHCVYSPLSGAAAAMQNQGVTSVLLGASSLLSNGALLAPAGTAMIASLAKAKRIPVIVASESYKFSERVQLDSIVYNELGQSNALILGRAGERWNVSNATVEPHDGSYASTGASTELPSFGVVNLRYDVTPISNISVVATEAGLIPPTSIPVLMREILSDLAITPGNHTGTTTNFSNATSTVEDSSSDPRLT